jgi:hypothetical protein
MEEKKQRLDEALGRLRRQYGRRIIRPLKEHEAELARPLATGFATLDAALDGGIPAGRTVEITTIPTSGGTTLALNILAAAQSQGLAVYVDTGRTFNPPYAARCGVALADLLLVQPHAYAQGLEIVHDLILAGDGRLVLLDTPYSLFEQAVGPLGHLLQRANALLRQSGCTLLCLFSLQPGSDVALALARPLHDALAHYAAVRLLVSHGRWRQGQTGIRGYNAAIHLLKPRQQELAIAITPDEVIE